MTNFHNQMQLTSSILEQPIQIYKPLGKTNIITKSIQSKLPSEIVSSGKKHSIELTNMKMSNRNKFKVKKSLNDNSGVNSFKKFPLIK